MAKSDSRDRWVIGIDDTDMPTLGGTGQLARRLAADIEQGQLGASGGVTRHQLFEGPGVPKTSRNSAAAVEFSGVESAEKLIEAATEIVAREAIAGSDPGVALAQLKPCDELLGFGQAAQAGLVTQEQARRVAGLAGIYHEGLGGDGGGVIGAVAAVGLRIGGNDGRFVGLPGIREIAGVVTVADILERTEIVATIDEADSTLLGPDIAVDLGDWVRPRLIGGRPVLVARHDGTRWMNADTRPS